MRVHSWLAIEEAVVFRTLARVQEGMQGSRQEGGSPGTPPPEGRACRGRIAPTPSGWLHLGHAATFRVAWQRVRAAGGTLLYRTEDLDPHRCRPEYVAAALEDLRWLGLDWDEGPDCGGPRAPYRQSGRLAGYRLLMEKLHRRGLVYPAPQSRREIREAAPPTSPRDGEILFPPDFRPPADAPMPPFAPRMNWRFRVPDGREVPFADRRLGQKAFRAGRDFGDFLVWRRDGVPSYELAVVADDHAMGITEVVRGEDLLVSTARQLLLYEALGWSPPAWFHCPLVADPDTGERLAKTHRSLALRELRKRGLKPAEVFARADGQRL